MNLQIFEYPAYIAALLKEKQLEVHPDKNGFIGIGKPDLKKKVNTSPIMFGNIETKCKVQDE